MSEVAVAAGANTLRLVNLEVRFGGLLALDRVSFEAGSTGLVGVIGPNGAGKTTMFDAICGFVAHRGEIWLGPERLTDVTPHMRARAGVGRSFQDARLFPSLTPRETLSLALQRRQADPGALAEIMGWPTARVDQRRLNAEVERSIELFGLQDHADKFNSELSTGTRRIVELAVVHVQDPRVILLDEPSAGIAQKEVEALADVIIRLRSLSRATILMVEHDIPLVRRVADRLIVLEYGKLIADGEVDHVLELPEVIAGYLGVDERAISRSGTMTGGPIAEVAPEEDPEPVLTVPEGLPATDNFRVPAPQLGAAGLAAILAMAVIALTAGPMPFSQRFVAHKPGAVATPTPSPTAEASPTLLYPSPLPIPPLPPPGIPLTYPPLPSAEPAPTPNPSPSPTPTPTPCVIPSPVTGLLPTPVPTCPPAP